MKKTITSLCLIIYTLLGFSQSTLSEEIQKITQASLTPTAFSTTAFEKVIDSTVFLRINASGDLNLETKNIFLYDSLAREIRGFNFNYDIEADTLLYNDQTNTTYSFPKVIESIGRFSQNQYTNIRKKTDTFSPDGDLENTLIELWDTNTGSFINDRLITNYFIGNSSVVDSIITEAWDNTNQNWVPLRWDFQYFGNDDLRDSVYTYSWNLNTGTWNLSNKIISEYDALGQQTSLSIFEWDTNQSRFNLLVEVLEYYNGDQFKDSTHVYTFFGGYYTESKTVFSYENDLPVTDTIYIWDAALGELRLANFQNYFYDSEGDIIELRTFAVNQNVATQITQVNTYYSTIETPSTGLSQDVNPKLECTFSNPHLMGSTISCDFLEENEITIKVFGLDGKQYLQQTGNPENFQLKGQLTPGLYILSLENKNKQIGYFKLVIP